MIIMIIGNGTFCAVSAGRELVLGTLLVTLFKGKSNDDSHTRCGRSVVTGTDRRGVHEMWGHTETLRDPSGLYWARNGLLDVIQHIRHPHTLYMLNKPTYVSHGAVCFPLQGPTDLNQ